MIRRIISARPTLSASRKHRLGKMLVPAIKSNPEIYTDIQELAKAALKDADTFYQRLSSRMERRYMAGASEMQKARRRLEARS